MFEPIAEQHQWTESEKAITLISRLEGEAQTVAAEIRPKTWTKLVIRLTNHFSPENQEISLQELQTRKQKEGENFATLSTAIEKLARRAIPK